MPRRNHGDTQSISRKRKSLEEDDAAASSTQPVAEIASARGGNLIGVHEKGKATILTVSSEKKDAGNDKKGGGDNKTEKDNNKGTSYDPEQRKQTMVGQPEDEENKEEKDQSDKYPNISEGSCQQQETSKSEAEASNECKKTKDGKEDKTTLLYTENIMAAAAATNEHLSGYATDSEDVHKPLPPPKRKKKKESKPAPPSTFAQLLEQQLGHQHWQQQQQQDLATLAPSGLIDNATVVRLIAELRLQVAQLQQSNQTLLSDVEGLKSIVAELMRLLISQQQQKQKSKQQQPSQQAAPSQSLNEQRLNLLRELYPETQAGNTNSMDVNLTAGMLAGRRDGDGSSGNNIDVDSQMSIFAAQQRQQQHQQQQQSLVASLAHAGLGGNTILLQQLLGSGQNRQQGLFHGMPQAQQAFQQHQGGARSSPSSSSLQQLLLQASIPGTVARLPPQILEQLQRQHQEEARRRGSNHNLTGKKGDSS
jgi:hypothetical protein